MFVAACAESHHVGLQDASPSRYVRTERLLMPQRSYWLSSIAFLFIFALQVYAGRELDKGHGRIHCDTRRAHGKASQDNSKQSLSI